MLQGAKDEIETANGNFPTIGIKHIRLITGYKKVGVRQCDHQQGNNKWFFSDVYWASNMHRIIF